MRPGARLSAAIEVLDRYLEGTPAEKALTNWARGARYAGSGDRAAIRDIVFDCLRRKASLGARAGTSTGRGLVAAHSFETSGLKATVALFDGSAHAPSILSETELAALNDVGDLDRSAQFDLPDWLVSEFDASLGDEALLVAEALKVRAPVFLRVTLARTSREGVSDALRKEDIETVAHENVDTALRVTSNPRRVASSAPYRAGLVELQDASSQAACCDLPPAKRMLDFCAGGGGKALAYGARVNAEIFAHDAHPRRMADLPARAKRAKQSIRQLDLQGCERAAPFDLVLIDVPCSGSGTWRRAPEGKWSLTVEGLNSLLLTQQQIMDQAAGLVGPGGTLAYMTCSVLKGENRDQIAEFLRRHSEFELVHERTFVPGSDGDGFYAAHLTRGMATP